MTHTHLYGADHLDHFDLHIYRPPPASRPPYECIEVGRRHNAATLGHNEHARISLLEAFVSGAQQGSSLNEHVQTHDLLASVYPALGTGSQGTVDVRDR